MAGAEDSIFSPGLALPVGSLVVPTTSADFGTCFSEAGWGCSWFSRAGWAILLFLGPPVVVLAALGPHHLLLAPKLQFADQELMLKELAT
jgi:hypothetical protein